MKGHPTDFWGKTNIRANQNNYGSAEFRWHPLVDHSADVAACFEALLSSTILNRRLAAVSGEKVLSPVQIARLSVLAALHDVGKFNLGFQLKIGSNPKLKAGHQLPALDLFGSPYQQRLCEALDLETMCEWVDEPEVLAQLLVASICHHGKPLQCSSDPDLRLWESDCGLSPFEGIRKLVHYIANLCPRKPMAL